MKKKKEKKKNTGNCKALCVSCKRKKERLDKPKKEKLLLLIPENISDRKLSVCKATKYQLNIKKKSIKCFKN